MRWNKIAPIVLVTIAIVGLWLNYKSYQKMGKKCTCEEDEGATPIT